MKNVVNRAFMAKKRNYIQSVTTAQFLQGMHVVCSSPEPELKVGTEGGDPNVKEIF